MKTHHVVTPPTLTRIPSSEALSGDIKLQHHVQKILTTALPTKRDLTAKQVVEILLSKHREYKRKNSSTLFDSVKVILSQTTSSSESSPTTQLNSNSTRKKQRRNSHIVSVGESLNKTPFNLKDVVVGQHIAGAKRKLHSDNFIGDEDQAEEQYEKEAKRLDSVRDSLTESEGGSMLNSGLRDRYKDIQRERDIISRKKAKDSEEVGVKLIKQESEVVTEEETVFNNSEHHTNGSNPVKTDSIATSSKKKKKKKVRLSNAPSSSNNVSINDDSRTVSLTIPTQRPKERYQDLGGLSSTLIQIRQLIEYPLAHPELFAHLGISPPRGVLFRGPPGCGKTHLANAIAGQLDVTYYRISAPEIVSSMSGESESRLRDLFNAAAASAPSIIFMDEIDAIAPKRGGDSGGGGKGMEKRIVAQLLTCMDALSPENNKNGNPVMVLGATNRPDSIDSALRRAGRFDREICLGVPDEEGRESILRVMTSSMRLDDSLDFRLLAKKTPGFVGADIRSLTKEAGVIAINRIFKNLLIEGVSSINTVGVSMNNICSSTSINGTIDAEKMTSFIGTKDETSKINDLAYDTNIAHCMAQDISSVTPFTDNDMKPLFVTMKDFLLAIPHVQPSSKREGFATVPDVSWKDVGALQVIREELKLNVLEPIQNPEKFKILGLSLPAGVLLYGPPGCGKTLLAKAIANESGANFISVKGPELLDKYVGESERAVRVVFERARSSSPCIVFFDELDSLCPKRGSDSSGSGVSERVVNQLLTEMDGLDSRRSVFVIAATNRPELIDPAMLRPGRLDKLLYVPLPQPQDRIDILKALAKNIKLAEDVDLNMIGQDPRSEGYSGADCAALLREAGLSVIRNETIMNKEMKNQVVNNTTKGRNIALKIAATDFDYAFDHVIPSVKVKDQSKYDKIRDRMARARTRGNISEEQQH